MPRVLTRFLAPGLLRDRELQLVVTALVPANPVEDFVPAYEFAMQVHGVDGSVGRIGLRLGDTEFLVKYAGQIGYDVDDPHRGHHYAARSCRLLLPLARAHRFQSLWITCNPENAASRRTCELVGAELVEIVDLPVDCSMYAEGERRKCGYRLRL